MSIRLTKNGRSIPLDSFANEVMKDVRAAATKDIRKDIERKLRGITCPDHPKAATVRVTLDAGMKQGKITVDSCCDKAEAAIKAVMEKHGHEEAPKESGSEEV